MQKNPAKTLSHDEKMGTMPIRPLLISTALPMMLSMLVQALYNVVDSLYVSRLASSEEALNAVSLSFPLQTLMIGIGIGTAVGTNAMLSRYLGAKMPYEAERSANTGLFLSIITSLVAQMVKRLPTMRETQVQSLGQEDPLEKEMATHSITLAWKTEERGRLQPMGSQRVGHD